MTYDITASLVLYRNDRAALEDLLNSFKESNLGSLLFVYDNSPTNELFSLFHGENVIYHHDSQNVGFGKGHNFAFSQISTKAKYHLIVNPDIYFCGDTLRKMIATMNNQENIGILAPKILFPDGSLQRTARCLPRPTDFFVRRFCPFQFVKERINRTYEIYSYNYSYPIEIPFISGCFMLVRSNLFQEIGGFDKQFFMYTEDIDLTRRMMKKAKTILDPSVSVYHYYERGSHKNFKLLLIFLKSAFRYFNKWGWFFDKERREINKIVCAKIRQSG